MWLLYCSPLPKALAMSRQFVVCVAETAPLAESCQGNTLLAGTESTVCRGLAQEAPVAPDDAFQEFGRS